MYPQAMGMHLGGSTRVILSLIMALISLIGILTGKIIKEVFWIGSKKLKKIEFREI